MTCALPPLATTSRSIAITNDDDPLHLAYVYMSCCIGDMQIKRPLVIIVIIIIITTVEQLTHNFTFIDAYYETIQDQFSQ